MSSLDTAFRVITVIGGVISILSTIFVLVIYWFFKDNRSFTLELQIWFTISVFLYNLGLLIPFEKDPSNPVCSAQAFMVNFFSVSQTLWTCIIAYSFLISMIKNEALEKRRFWYRIVFLLISLIIPLGLSLPIVIKNLQGDSQGYCWLATEDPFRINYLKKVQMIYYVFDIYFWLLNIFLVIKIFIFETKYPNNKNERFSYIKWYPIINLISALISIINGLIEANDSNEGFKNFISIIEVITNGTQGFFYMLLFIISPNISQSLYIFWRRVFKKRDLEEDVEDFIGDNDSSGDRKIELNHNQEDGEEEYEYEEEEDDGYEDVEEYEYV